MSYCGSSLSSFVGVDGLYHSIRFVDQHRRMWFPTSMSWTKVRSSILSCFLLSELSSDYRFSYIDEEGDKIAVEQDNEYILAIESAASKGSDLQLSLEQVIQNGVSLDGAANNDLSVRDNSDVEEFDYVSVNNSGPPTTIHPHRSAEYPSGADSSDDQTIFANVTAGGSRQKQMKMIDKQDKKESPPSPVSAIPSIVQDLPVCPSTNVVVVEQTKKSTTIDEALCRISSLLATSDAQEGLVKAVASSVINHCITIASPSDGELIRSNQSLLEERVNDGVKGRINKGLLSRLLIRRLFLAKKKTSSSAKKPKRCNQNQPSPKIPSPSLNQQEALLAFSASVPSSTSSSPSSNGSGRAIHLGVRCDECNIGPIVGARFHCITCDQDDQIRQRGGWDCCQHCEPKTNHCTLDNVHHVLIKMKTPAKIVVDKEQPSADFIASGHPLIYDAFAHFGDESTAVPIGVVGDSASCGEEKKSEKQHGKKYAKKLLRMMIKQFSDDSLTSDDSSTDDEIAQKKLAKKMEKETKKATKAIRKTQKLKLKAEKKAGKKAKKASHAEQSTPKMENENKEEEIEKKEEKIEKKEEEKVEPKEIEQEENQENKALNSNPSTAYHNQILPLDLLLQHLADPHPEVLSSSSSSPSVDQSPIAIGTINEQKSDEFSLPPLDLPVPLPVAHPMITFPSVPSLPQIIPNSLFQQVVAPSSLPPSNPFSFPSQPFPIMIPPSPSMSSPLSIPVLPVAPLVPAVYIHQDQLSQLTAMGFPRERSMELLNYYSGDLRKALNRLL